ncbi:MAG TPA: cytochrome c peroxidase [Verrucomicrobiae bacterium]|nr:cytochrome c peroxidase [Verrucomicrobiae bacterium]
MKSITSIELSTRCICATILGASLVCSTVLAQNGKGGNNGNGNGNGNGNNGNNGNGNGGNPNPTPNPNPPPGVNGFGVAIPVPVLNMAQYLPGGTNEDPDVVFLIQRIQENYTNALEQLAAAPPGSSKFTQALGKVLIYDQKLSVNNNVACATCHIDYSGFTGASSFFNGTTSADPGSVPITNAGGRGPNYRISSRKPQTYAYAPFSGVLHFNVAQQDFYGGNFWDMRATGIRLGNPAAEQAQGPPVNPLEHALFDIPTYVYKLSKSDYASFFEEYWGKGSLSSINWPPNIETFAATPGPAPSPDPLLAQLSQADQNLVMSAYDHAAMSIAAYEAGPEVSPFTSKFDYALANPTQSVLTKDELEGWNLFRGKAQCNTCHLDGTENIKKGKITPADAASVAPLFTDFTSANIGTPQNFALPFLYENMPDQFGFVANPAGINYVDLGVGGFLASAGNPNPDWAALAPQFNGKVQVPTLRNVDLRPRPDFVKAYMHNGYFKTLESVVHFYNTRDTLNGGVHLPAGGEFEGGLYWPPPEVNMNVDQTIGHLGLSAKEEEQIVLFMKTLTDGYVPSNP